MISLGNDIRAVVSDRHYNRRAAYLISIKPVCGTADLQPNCVNVVKERLTRLMTCVSGSSTSSEQIR